MDKCYAWRPYSDLGEYIAFDKYEPDKAIQDVWDYTMTAGDPSELLTDG